jgi:hypothetical protein
MASMSPSPASTSRARLRTGSGNAANALTRSYVPFFAHIRPRNRNCTCGLPARSGTSAFQRTGFGSTATWAGDISHSFT